MVQIKVWLLGISPVVWRRLLVPGARTLRGLHGVIQIAMGREGIHLYPFCLGAAQGDDKLPGRRVVPFEGAAEDVAAFAL